MNYNDFSILTDSEYVKLAKEYENNLNHETPTKIESNYQDCFDLLCKCKHYLQFKNENNYSLIKELNNHELILTKIIENFSLNLNIKYPQLNEVFNFNLFTYLKLLYKIKLQLNYFINIETKENNKNILKISLNELNNLFISIFDILSKLNIKIFKFM